MRQSDAGASYPSRSSSSFITMKVSGGNVWKPFQFEAAGSLRPVSAATARVPPSASTTSAVVVSCFLIATPNVIQIL